MLLELTGLVDLQLLQLYKWKDPRWDVEAGMDFKCILIRKSNSESNARWGSILPACSAARSTIAGNGTSFLPLACFQSYTL